MRIITANLLDRFYKKAVKPLENKADALDESSKTHMHDKNNPHVVTKAQLKLDLVPNVETDNQTPTHSRASSLSNLVSGETLSKSLGKISKAIYDFIVHKDTKGNENVFGHTKLTDTYTSSQGNAAEGIAPSSYALQQAYSTLNATLKEKSDVAHSHSNYAASTHSHSTYAPSVHTHSYLPLSGGKVDGGVTFAEDIRFSGNMGIAFRSTIQSFDNSIYSSEKNYLNFNAGKYIEFYADYVRPEISDFTSCGSTNYRWKNIYSINAVTVGSNRDRKKDISELDNRYERLFMDLKPVKYKWRNNDELPEPLRIEFSKNSNNEKVQKEVNYKTNHDRIHTGLIAQEVQNAMDTHGISDLEFAAFCKDIVYDNKENKIPKLDESGNPVYDYSLRYEEFISLCIHMIQKNTIEIQLLKAENKEMKEKIDKLS